MTDVNFEEQDWQATNNKRFEVESKPSVLISLVLKTGIVKDTKRANYVLLAVATVFFGLMIYFFTSASGGSSRATNVPPGMNIKTMPGVSGGTVLPAGAPR